MTSFEPRLINARIGELRFVPLTNSELYSSIFTWWNLLDKQMFFYDANYAYQTGYIRELQLRRMVELVRQPAVRTYCEIGMNGGHSVAAMLQANENISVHVFDLMSFNYSYPIANILAAHFSKRFHIHAGNSLMTIPKWLKQRKHHCDLIYIDGDHTPAVRSDFMNMQHAASRSHWVVVDDIQMPPGSVLRQMVREKRMVLLDQYGPFSSEAKQNPCMRTLRGSGFMCMEWGFAIARYVPREDVAT